jgi:hypothetical protein
MHRLRGLGNFGGISQDPGEQALPPPIGLRLIGKLRTRQASASRCTPCCRWLTNVCIWQAAKHLWTSDIGSSATYVHGMAADRASARLLIPLTLHARCFALV